MFAPEITALIADSLKQMPSIVIEPTLKRDIDELVASVLPPMKLAVVDDSRTKQAYGDQVFRALKGRYASTHVTLEGIPVPDKQTVHSLRAQTLSCDAIVAIGTGTINDLCKYVSHKDSKPYIVFPTAASMNGYLSTNASISDDGFKKTLPAHMPKAVFCDLAVIASAPSRLNKSGFGDSLARPTAQADWLLSHLLLDTPYDEKPFKLLAALEPELFEHARGIGLGDVKSIELLVKILLLSGLGMTIASGSYPASQGEHLIAHTYEMMHEHLYRDRQKKHAFDVFHGESIGVTSLTMARIQERALASKPRVQPDDFSSEKMIDAFGSKTTAEARKAFDAKQILAKAFAPERLRDWDAIAQKVSAVTMPSSRLEAALKAADAPISPEKIGWDVKEYEMSVKYARYMRERFTFLDLIPG